MAVAILSPEPEDAVERGKKGGRGRKAIRSDGLSGVLQPRISEARAVLAHSRELADAVMEKGNFFCFGRSRGVPTFSMLAPPVELLQQLAGAQAPPWPQAPGHPQGRDRAVWRPLAGVGGFFGHLLARMFAGINYQPWPFHGSFINSVSYCQFTIF